MRPRPTGSYLSRAEALESLADGPFNGGQCVGVAYDITVDYYELNNSPGCGVATQATARTQRVWGPVSGLQYGDYGSTAFCGTRPKQVLIKCRGSVAAGGPSSTETLVLVGSAEAGISESSPASISKVLRTDGQPDNCGNPPKVCGTGWKCRNGVIVPTADLNAPYATKAIGQYEAALPVLFTGGQCPGAIYRLNLTFQRIRTDTGADYQNYNFSSVFVYGPIADIRVDTSTQPSINPPLLTEYGENYGIFQVLCHGTVYSGGSTGYLATQQWVTFDQQRAGHNGFQFFRWTGKYTINALARDDGQPDTCGDPPPVCGTGWKCLNGDIIPTTDPNPPFATRSAAEAVPCTVQISAGPDQVLLCASQVTLNGASTTATSVVWTQISGDPITIINPTSINPTVQLPPGYNSSTPLILRVSVPPTHRFYDDVRIANRLEDYVTASTYGVSNDNGVWGCFVSKIERYVAQPASPVPGQDSFLLGDKDNYYISWTLPECSSELAIGYRLQQNINGIYQDVASYLYNPALSAPSSQSPGLVRFDNFNKLAQIGDSFRVVAIGSHLGQRFENTGPIYRVDSNLGKGSSVVADDWVETGSYQLASDTTLSTTNLTFNIIIESRVENDTVELPSFYGTSNDSVISTTTLTFYITYEDLGLNNSLNDPIPYTSYYAMSSDTTKTVTPLLWNAGGLVI